MSWYYADGGQQVGPIEEAALDELVRQGTVRGDTLVWREGMASWQPHGTLRPAPPVLPTPALPTAAPIAAGRRYAGFWIRFLARIIDGILLGVAGAVVRVPLTLLGIGAVGFSIPSDSSEIMAALPAILQLVILSTTIQLAMHVAYEVYFVSTRGATPGKIALGIKIVRADGSAVPVDLAFGRYFAQWLSVFTFMIGYIIAGFDEEKRSLHDHICGTRVVYAA